MGKSKHRKGHKAKVQKHKQDIQLRRHQFQKLVDQLEVEMIKAQMDQPLPTVQIQNQPQIKLTQ